MIEEKRTKIYFLPNGLTVAFLGGEQQPHLQESWLLLYVTACLSVYGIDPTKCDFVMPDVSRAEIIDQQDGYNFRIITP